MARKPLTEEQRQYLREQLARGRATAAANRAAKKAGLTAPPAPDEDANLAPPPAAAAPRRDRLLEGIDPAIADLITDAELDEIERREREAAAAARKKKALDAVQAQVRHRMRVEHDLIAADTLRSEAERRRLMEPVRFRVRLPSSGAGDARTAGFMVDGRLFQEGQVYTEPRAVFESLRDIHYRAWKSELMFRTLDQHKPGNSAAELVGQVAPVFEVES